jgi:hypothetical protein
MRSSQDSLILNSARLEWLELGVDAKAGRIEGKMNGAAAILLMLRAEQQDWLINNPEKGRTSGQRVATVVHHCSVADHTDVTSIVYGSSTFAERDSLTPRE